MSARHPSRKRRGPPWRSTGHHRNQVCYEDNKTATMATTVGATRKPGSLESSSKHDKYALKVKNIHRLNVRYRTRAQTVQCLQAAPFNFSFEGLKDKYSQHTADLACMERRSGRLHTCAMRIES